MARFDTEREQWVVRGDVEPYPTFREVSCCLGVHQTRSLVFPGAILPPESGWCLACPAHWHGPDSGEIMELHHHTTRHPTVAIPAREAEPVTGK